MYRLLGVPTQGKQYLRAFDQLHDLVTDTIGDMMNLNIALHGLVRIAPATPDGQPVPGSRAKKEPIIAVSAETFTVADGTVFHHHTLLSLDGGKVVVP